MAEQQALTARVVTVREWMTKQAIEIAKAVPKHIDPIRFARVALTTIAANPQLLECTRESLMACVMQTAAWGLDLDPVLGEAYMIPFNERGTPKAKLVLGYQGLISLARRSGEIRTITPRAVFEKDTFVWEFGLEEKLVHRPYMGSDEPGSMVAVYSVALLKNGDKVFDVMTKREVDAIRERSRASHSGPWVTDYVAMARKTVVKRQCKYLPKTVELSQAIALDERAELGEDQSDLLPMPMVPDRAPQDALDAVADTLKQRKTRKAKAQDDIVVEAAKTTEESAHVAPPDPSDLTPEQATALDRQLFGEDGERG